MTAKEVIKQIKGIGKWLTPARDDLEVAIRIVTKHRDEFRVIDRITLETDQDGIFFIAIQPE
jgi:uncharacterized protein YebE (UPF0316 family)